MYSMGQYYLISSKHINRHMWYIFRSHWFGVFSHIRQILNIFAGATSFLFKKIKSKNKIVLRAKALSSSLGGCHDTQPGAQHTQLLSKYQVTTWAKLSGPYQLVNIAFLLATSHVLVPHLRVWWNVGDFVILEFELRKCVRKDSDQIQNEYEIHLHCVKTTSEERKGEREGKKIFLTVAICSQKTTFCVIRSIQHKI